MEYRPYRPKDLDRCTDLAKEAWPIISRVADDQNALPFMRAYVKHNLALSDYAEVCCDGDRVLGFLMGYTKKQKHTPEQKRENSRIFRDVVRGRYGRVKKQRRLLLSLIISAVKVEILCARFDGEVLLFVVDEAYRGHGIGRAMLDRFLRYAAGQGLKTVYLSTDTESNWRFYERYGFTKYRDFYDNGLSVMTGKRMKSFIYYYPLQER
mgnify:CR=1 FL=1